MTPEEIKNIRLKLRMSQMRFAVILNVNVKTISNWELGITPPSRKNVKKLEKLNF